MGNNIYSVISLQSFTVFSEYFIALSIIYILIVITLITYNSYGLMLQKATSECIALVLFMSCYLMINDDLLTLDFCSFNYSIINDYFAFFTKFLLCFFSAIYFLFISDSLKEQKLTSFEYLVIILFSLLGLMLMCSSHDLLVTYLAIELSSLAFYVLASFRKTSSYSVEGGIKYFITGSVASAFFLLGSSFIYATSGSINFYDFYQLYGCSFYYVTPFRSIPNIESYPLQLLCYFVQENKGNFDIPELFNSSFVELGLTLILFSLFIKLALAPFHLWSLDVYEGSPTSSTMFFAVISKLSTFVILIRLCYTGFFSIKDCWQFYSLWVGIFSIFVGAFGGLKQRKLKTLLAYSSTSHMGYILIALSTSIHLGVPMLLFYMVIYTISGLGIWSIILFLRLRQKNPTLKYNKELGDLALLRKSNAALAFSLALTMFSIAGIPPMVGFLAKLSVFLPLIWFSSYFVALASVIFSVVSTFYYIRVIKVLYFENLLVGKLYYPINSEKTIILSILIFLLIFLFTNPTLLYLFCYKTILSSFDIVFYTLKI
jgi:NADH-quinone oxidoreductase subunit N